MHFKEAIGIAFDTLRAHKLRSFLTLLGVIISVCTLVAVIALVQGVNLYVATKIGRLGLNTFSLNQFSLHDMTDRQRFARAVHRNPPLRMTDYDYLRHSATIPIAIAASVANNSGTLKAQGQEMDDVSVRGVTPSDLVMESFHVAQGRFIGHFDEQHRTQVAFIGPDVVKHIFPGINPLDRHILVNGSQFRIIGVASKQGNVFGNSLDQFVMMPISTFRKLNGKQASINIGFKAGGSALVQPAMDQVRMLMRARRHLAYTAKANFGLIGSSAVMDLWHSITGAIAAVMVGVSVVFLVVGGIVIMNIMLAAVTERTHEVGIRKAIGARRADILRQFLVESAVLSTTGGVLGILAAWLFTLLAGRFTPIPFSLPWTAVIMALLVSTAVGLFFGIYPAGKAARLDPIVALRSET